MLTIHALKELYQKKRKESGDGSVLDDAVLAFLENRQVDFDALTNDIRGLGDDRNPLDHLEKWRKLLAYGLLIDLTNSQPYYQDTAAQLAKQLSQKIFWLEFQPLNALVSLTSHFAGLSHKPIITKQLSSGAATLESGEHYPWADIPSPLFHAELGVVWAVLGKLTGDHELVLAAIHLAEWQLNTLDYSYRPYIGLFTQEADASLSTLLSYNYLLFHMVASIADRPDMEYAAERQLEGLQHQENLQCMTPLMILLECWMEKMFPPVEAQYTALNTAVIDHQTALAGYRSEKLSLITTLFGGHTGLGCYRQQDVEIVSYGPQQLPLGDCKSFGIEKGVSRISKGSSEIEIASNDSGFSIKGCTRIASSITSKESFALFRSGKPNHIWMETKQSFDGKKLLIDVSFLGLRSSDQVAMVFFVKAKECLLEGGKSIQSRSLEGYSGPLHSTTYSSVGSAVWLNPQYARGQMQIIPLSGKDSFWGADFLHAYIIDSKELHYAWEVEGPVS